MSTCTQCGAEMRSAKENYRYDESGLPNVTLVGVTVSRCPACGESEVAIPRIEELHRALAMAVTRKPSRLAGPEIRFLRKWLGRTGPELAALMGVSREVVSRWENDRDLIGATNDRLLRLLVANHEPATHYPVEEFERIADGADPARWRAKVVRGAWEAEAA